ncbi:SusC/RagA family TonB-linked outer membrane protein [Chitinophaga pinensis]|uniref:TonB-dependent receptor plug n=1 Tax=Chitinophaga pinensis (strain ATCC 43595 / DSM 2588 / LMG 13176 / NBRC 15968 / NCIMB 11800 / UQM 2034) TaxID=485918 RepID=A0A979G1I0_CHIPD|nr:TonB-dependent receptor [Chitinophaga pinensis]ACU59048.1 TonB-dependent receptor plug [Chitinophaga pinensis DSM 2588]
MFKRNVTLVLALLFSTALFAQQTQIRGQVLAAENRQPLPGVTVKINRTTLGTTTDQGGHFQLTVPSSKTVISVSSIGRETTETEVRNGDQNIVILLKPANTTLGEVVAVAYTNVKRSGYPGAVATVSSDKINNRLTPNVTNALQGLVTGLQTTSSNGQPGNSSTIRIRGVGSINASSAPLFVVDGAPYDGDINAINGADIESISVLKDATAANLYGSRAANGVIIITTKQGKKGESAVNINFNQGWSSRAVKDYDKLNTDQYFELYWEALRNKQLTNGQSAAQAAATASARVVSDLGINPFGPTFPQPVGTDGKIVAGAHPLWNDDWEKGIQQSGKYTQAQLSFSGGSDKSTYYVSGGYVNNEGAYMGSGFKRYNFKSNITLQAKSWLKTGLNLSGSSAAQDYPASSDSRTDNVVLFGRTVPGFYPIYQRNPDGTYLLDASGQKLFDYGAYRPSAALARENLIGSLPLDKNRNTNENLSARTFVEAALTKALHIKTSYNVDYVNTNALFYTNPLVGGDAEIGGAISKSNGRRLSYTWNNILTYDADLLGGHHLNLLAGHEYYYFNSSSQSGSRQKFALPDLYEPAAASQLNDFTGVSDNYAKLSFFGQGQYNYLNKYYLTASVRRDGSSRFSPDSRWGTFWSTGASWRLSEEQFLRSVSCLNTLTLKGSYGASGNDNLSTYYAYLALFDIKNNLGNGGVITSRLATPGLKWESNLNLNIGLDYALFDNRLYGNINYYNRTSKDLLYAKPMASSTGFSSISANIGALRNTGLELELNVIPIQTRDFKWNIGLNVAHNKNKITELPQKEIISGTKKLTVGSSIYEFYLREWAGVDAKTGNPLWYQTDAEGKKVTTTNYASATQYYAGSALPDVTGGITNSFNYKNFDLSFLLSYSIGGKVLDLDYVSLLSGATSPGRNWSTELLERWTPEHTNTDVPRFTTDNLNWTSTSTRFLYSATYARLKTVSLGYSLPNRLLSRIGIKSAKVYGLGENLLTFYGHKGMDPEQSIDGTTYYQYPAMKTFSVGIQVGL